MWRSKTTDVDFVTNFSKDTCFLVSHQITARPPHKPLKCLQRLIHLSTTMSVSVGRKPNIFCVVRKLCASRLETVINDTFLVRPFLVVQSVPYVVGQDKGRIKTLLFILTQNSGSKRQHSLTKLFQKKKAKNSK